MPRPRSARFLQARRDLLARLEEGYLRPGDRFPSNRALAARFGLSYQTAHRLAAGLLAEGRLRRVPGSGTFVAGDSRVPQIIECFFDERSLVPGSFGHFLRARLTARFQERSLPFRFLPSAPAPSIRPQSYPILWDNSALLSRLVHTAGFGLLLGAAPPPGLDQAFLDSVEVDDFAGGILAAQVFRRRWHIRRPAVFAGPRRDPRSEDRLRGFRTVFPAAPALHSRGWHLDSALRAAPRLLRLPADGLFCANDRLAQAILQVCALARRPAPPLLGFDDAPVARDLQLSTIGLPWDEFTDAVATLAAQRLAGYNGTARRIILAPRVVLR